MKDHEGVWKLELTSQGVWNRLVQPRGEKALGVGGGNCRFSLLKGGRYRGGSVRVCAGVCSNRTRGRRHRLQQEQFLLGRRKNC